ncbi:hypothetical protein GCM10027168_30240 [Streptomyces capparidis]
MGYTVLYIAFGVVALWLLGEVLFQYKAQLRWRVLAFAGFLGVVGGVAAKSVVLIAVGAMAFAAGQTFVTMSYRRGFSAGWALAGRPSVPGRRRGAGRSAPTLAVSPVEPEGDLAAAEPAAPVYQPHTMDDDTGGYAAYGSFAAAPEEPPAPGAHDPFTVGPEPQAAPPGGEWAGYDTVAQQSAGHGWADYPPHTQDVRDVQGYGWQDGYGGQGWDEQHGYAADPAHDGTWDTGQGWPQQPPAPSYPGEGGYDPYDPYSTPPGGVWVPQQPSAEPYPQPDPGDPGQGWQPEANDPPAGYDPYRH